jgi:hypothetical protein
VSKRHALLAAALLLLIVCGLEHSASAQRSSGHAAKGSHKNVNRQSTEQDMAWGHAVKGLRLGLSTQDAKARFSLQNVGKEPIEVLSHVEAGEKQYDWYTVILKDAHGHTRTLGFVADRDESWSVKSRLDAGGSFDAYVDLAAWARQPVNGGQPLAAGAYEATATYDISADQADGCWTGRLEAGPVKLTVPAR